MKIENIRIHKFGCHQNLDLNLSQGINVINGNNESGKSTLLAFIRAVLYGFDSRVADNPRKKYLPWGSNPEDRFGGEIAFSHNGKKYKAVAVFTQSKRTDIITLYNDITGEVIPLPDGNTIGEYVLGLSAGAFDCSVFAPQLESKGDFTKDKNGQLFNKLSSAPNSVAESSQEAVRRLKKAIHQITNRGGSGMLDKLQQKLEKLKAELNRVENSQTHVGQLTDQLEDLNDQEEKLKNRRNYYIRFGEIKKAFNVLDSRKNILRKQKEIEDIEQDIESLRTTMDPALYDDIKPAVSGLFVTLFIVALLLFGCGVFATVYTFLSHSPLYVTLGAGVAALLCLLLSIIFLLKIKTEPVMLNDIGEEFQQLEYLKYRLASVQEELEDAMEGKTIEELETKWQTTVAMLQETSFTPDTMKYIRNCPSEVLSEKTEEITKALMEVQQKISYIRGNVDSINDTRFKPEDSAFLEGNDNIYTVISETEEKISFYKDKLTALYLAQSVLEQSAEELQNTFGPVINSYTEKYLTAITGKDYGKIKIAPDFKVSVYDSENLSGHLSSDYSGATEDQIYLAMRFALTTIISPENDPLPLYLDDPFVQYDDNRYNGALRFISDFTKETEAQIIMATCQNRDLSSLGEFNYLSLN